MLALNILLKITDKTVLPDTRSSTDTDMVATYIMTPKVSLTEWMILVQSSFNQTPGSNGDIFNSDGLISNIDVVLLI